MAPKTHRAGPAALPRTHSRSSSAGSSKAGLNLHFTQKDPAPPKQPERPKKNGFTHSRNTSPYPQRVNSGLRAASKEHIQPQPSRHAPPSNLRQGVKPKAGFTIASTSADEDDEWVSSESGAATPNSPDTDTGRSRTPVDQRNPPPPPPVDELMTRPETPRAQQSSMSRVPTIRPPEAPSRAPPPVPAARGLPPALPAPLAHPEPVLHQPHLYAEPRAMETRSENTSPVHRTHPHKRQSVTRPPSTHSVTSRTEAPLRPHPLIRGQSFGQNVPVTPRMVALAPLIVTSDTAPPQTSPTQHGDKLTTSPSSIKTAYAQPSPNRRTSISSARSVATVPNHPPNQSNQSQLSRAAHDRNRTLSTISSSSTSSMQALSSLAHLPTTRPSTPQYTSHFPAASLSASLEATHPLLPPPYLSAHLSILAYRSPLKESFDRVSVAREQQKPHKH
ncbi:hypothetical protein BV22DRAFT_1104258 [Leucogyrophana mollusca]|uniref:Uncharacterized protein n=1 Tax=Leucogyrophana mollusca TaxID=85980 RepID=A0ACB8BMI2_9AGAM|nr:hypothetical protein BV22DRAFT_1104258 [Leucogyrophana mollusca]